MKTLKSNVQEFLENKKWFYSETDDGFVLDVEITPHQFSCNFHVLEKEQIIVFYSRYPHKIKKKQLKPLAWLITELNIHFSIGNFELDTHSGILRYKTSVDVEGLEVPFLLIDNLVNANLSIFTENYSQILKKS